MRQRIIALTLFLILILFALNGCGGATEEEPVVPDDSKIAEIPEPDSEPVIPMGPNPLTGISMELDYVNDRPTAVIFNNLYQAMPQLGISKADIIYEIPVEGGITRMMGLFQSLNDVETLGSIRSARPCFLEVALGHDAFLVHAGGSEDAYSKIRKWDVDNMDGVRGGNDAKIFWRDSARKKALGYEHSLVTSGEKIKAYLSGASYRLEHEDGYGYDQTYSETAMTALGDPAEYFELYFSHYKTGRFTYNAETVQYQIVQYGDPYVDGNTSEQVGFDNVLVLETDISRVSGDTEGRLNIRLTGTGEGTYFCEGKAIPIQWSKEDRHSPFVYKTADGKALVLKQGNSYICIMDPDSSKLTIPAEETEE